SARGGARWAGAIERVEKMAEKPVVLTVPMGGPDHRGGVVDLWTGRAYGAWGEIAPPAEMAPEIAKAREQLVENAAECDDAILEKYLEEGELSAEDLRQALVSGTRGGKILPVLCGAAT